MWAVIEVRENDGELLMSGGFHLVDSLTVQALSAVMPHGIPSNTLYAAWALYNEMSPEYMARYAETVIPYVVLVYVQGRLFELDGGYNGDVQALGE